MSFDDESSCSSGVEDNGRILVRTQCAGFSVCAQVFAFPETFNEMREFYNQYGFLDTATVQGLSDVLRPYVTVSVKCVRSS